MAQLKDTVVSGNLRVTDTTLTDTLQTMIIRAPSTSGGTTYSAGTSGNVLKSNGTSTYWGTLTAADVGANYSAGTGLSLSGTKFNHSNSVTEQTTAKVWKFAFDACGHITGTPTESILVTNNTNLTITPSNNAFGYVSGQKRDAWNFQQTDGTLISQYYNASWQTEIFMDYRTGQMSTRGKNNGTWKSWRIQLDSGNWSTYCAAASHTHNYAGSSSAGGAATSANKLNTDGGSATQPVYFSNGIPVATTYSLNKTVPSNALFTDTWEPLTGATSSTNGTVGYINTAPPSDGYNTKYFRADGTWATPPGTYVHPSYTRSDTTTTPAQLAHAGTFTAITSVTSTNGHVTAVNTATYKLPAQYTHPTYTRNDTTSTASPAHGETFTAIDSVTSTNGHVTAVNVKTITLPAQYSHPTYTRSNTTSTASPAHGGTFTAIDSITTNSLGHVTAVNTKTVTLPTDQNTDTKVTQSASTTANYRPLVLGEQNSTDVSTLANTVTNQVYTTTKIYAQPSTGNVYASTFVGKLSISTGGTWIEARDNTAVLNGPTTTANHEFYPIGFAKTNDGGWAIGALADSNTFNLSYTTDANYASNTNTSTYTIEFPKASGTVALTNHTHNYIPLTGSNAISGSLETNSENAGFISPGENNRKMSLIGGGIRYYIGTSNWASGIYYYNGDTSIGNFGAYGTPSTCDYFYMGKTYNNYSMRMENNDTGKMTLRGTLPQLKFQQTTTNKTCNNDNAGIIAHPADTAGMNMTIQSGGNMIIGSGEYPSNFYAATKANDSLDHWLDNGENTYVGADNFVMIQTNANTIANRKSYVFGVNFNLAFGSNIYFKIGSASSYHSGGLVAGSITADRTWTLPDASGTVALTGHTHDSLTTKTLTATTLENTAGNFFFGGSNLLGGNYDWVGIQADAGNDKFQLIAQAGGLIFRQNDSGGTDSTNWNNWVNLLTPDTISGTNGITATVITSTIGSGTSAVTYNYGVQIGHSNSVTAVTTAGMLKVKYDAHGHITGSSAFASADVSALLNLLTTGSSTPVDADYYIAQYAGGGTTTTTYHRRPVSALWTYMKGKADSVYAPLSHNHAAGDITSGALPIAHGGTGATTRLNALKALTDENVGTSAQYFLTITNSWGKGGYTSVANAKTVLGLGSAAYTASTDYATAGHTHSNYLGAVNANGYYGMAKPDGTTTDWIRTTNKGLIPYEAGGAGSGHQQIGTSTWYFLDAYIDNVHGTLHGNASTATTLKTARSIALGSDFQGSATFDGSADITISGSHYHSNADGGNKANYPWHRIATTSGKSGSYVDVDSLLLIRAKYNGGSFGILKISLRTNGSGAACDISARWIVRYGFSLENVVIAEWGNTGDAVYADVFLKCDVYPRVEVVQLLGSRAWTLVASNEVNNTTTSDKLTSTEVYASVASAATEIHGKAYTKTANSISAGRVSRADTADKLNTDAGDVDNPVYFANGVPVVCNLPASGVWAAVGYSNMTCAGQLSAGTLRYRNFRSGLVEICGYIKPSTLQATYVLGTVSGIKPSNVSRYGSIYNGSNKSLVTGALIYIDLTGKITIQCTSSSVFNTSSEYYFSFTYLLG